MGTCRRRRGGDGLTVEQTLYFFTYVERVNISYEGIGLFSERYFSAMTRSPKSKWHHGQRRINEAKKSKTQHSTWCNELAFLVEVCHTAI